MTEEGAGTIESRYLQSMLRRSGKTQAWLAEKVEVSPNAVSKWFKTGKISRENFRKAALCLSPTLPLNWRNHPEVRKLDDGMMSEEELAQVAQDVFLDDFVRKAFIRSSSSEPASNIEEQQGQYLLDPNAHFIPQLDVEASMGNGIAISDHEDVVDSARVNLVELRRRVSFSAPENLRLITGIGDSMSPTFDDGDVILVDVGVTDLKVDAIYVLQRDDELFIKRVQRRITGGFRIISDNRSYEPDDIENPVREGFEVKARAICVWNMKKL